MPDKVLRKYRTVFGEKLELNKDKKKHILLRHPEIELYLGRIAEVLNSPDMVKLSKRSDNFHLYYKFFSGVFGGKYILVVANVQRKSVATVFITDKIKAGETIWKK